MAGPQALDSLRPAFRQRDALREGLTPRDLDRLRDEGTIERLSRGLYYRLDTPPADLDLLEIAARAPDATLCLRSALTRHDLIDDVPSTIDLALPRGQRHPKTAAPAQWHSFDHATFGIGRTWLEISGPIRIGIYSQERSIIDAFRLKHQEGHELAYESLKSWLRRREAQPAKLLKMARDFPKAEPSLRQALEILL